VLADLGKTLVVSPHLDDAVFACGELLARFPGTIVATVFAGIPPDMQALTVWDAASGFDNARQAVLSRREEDRNALQVLHAAPIWLDFCDSQYHVTTSVLPLADALKNLIEKTDPATILLPAGLFHSDHVLTHEALLMLWEPQLDRTWLMYEEPAYRRIPGLLQRRLATLLQDGIQATPVACSDRDMAARKREAVHYYASQLRALRCMVTGGYTDAFAPERYWHLEPTSTASPEAGDEHLA